MYLKGDEIDRIAGLIYAGLVASGVTIKGQESKIRADVTAVITKNMADEAAIDAEAEKLMEKFKGEIAKGKVDYQKMFGMIKKQLAKDRKFVW